jgi:Xaa-Pro aminopeptidase
MTNRLRIFYDLKTTFIAKKALQLKTIHTLHPIKYSLENINNISDLLLGVEMNIQYNARLKAVREKMEQLNLDALIVPHEDEYLLEEVSEYNNRLKWLSGFSGTAGVAVVLKDRAIMYVDGRYKVQVAEQVNKQLFFFSNLSEFENNSWLTQELPKHARIGVDLKLHSFSWYKLFTRAVNQEHMNCIALVHNLIDSCWQERPNKEINSVELLEEKYHGKPDNIKRAEVSDLLKAANVDSTIITGLDAICWLLNLRGQDVPCLPVFYATVVINQNGGVICFLDLQKLPEPIKTSFDCDVSFQCESELENYLSSISSNVIQIDPQTINAGLVELLHKNDDNVEIVEGLDPINLLKSQKNAIEIAGIKACHLRDGSAVVNFLSWLDVNTRLNIFNDEAYLSNKLEDFRKKDSLYQQPSFDTVSAVASNGAMCHYNHKDTTAKLMENNSIYLVDSGAHYLDGSTDVTRTVAIGSANDEQKKMATLVLKGHIALAKMKFPQGTTGQHVDAFARQYLWQQGYDYAHGTGHGVGHNLNVHEGPQRIAKFNSEVALLPGMVVSIEPGYYREGEFGIRHENLYLVKESKTPMGAEIPMLQFDVLTYAPFDQNLIVKKLLSEDEIDWLNSYHQMVYDCIEPLISDANTKWLAMATKSL